MTYRACLLGYFHTLTPTQNACALSIQHLDILLLNALHTHSPTSLPTTPPIQSTSNSTNSIIAMTKGQKSCKQTWQMQTSLKKKGTIFAHVDG
jgi:hypothetical protein